MLTRMRFIRFIRLIRTRLIRTRLIRFQLVLLERWSSMIWYSLQQNKSATAWRYHCRYNIHCETYDCVKILGSALFDDEDARILFSTKKGVCHWNTLVPIVPVHTTLGHEKRRQKSARRILRCWAVWCMIWEQHHRLLQKNIIKGIDDLDTLVSGRNWSRRNKRYRREVCNLAAGERNIPTQKLKQRFHSSPQIQHLIHRQSSWLVM